jgi:hypothetical protein
MVIDIIKITTTGTVSTVITMVITGIMVTGGRLFNQTQACGVNQQTKKTLSR